MDLPAHDAPRRYDDPARSVSAFKHPRTTLERLEKFISEIYFTDVNLRGKMYECDIQIPEIVHLQVHDDLVDEGSAAFEKISNKLDRDELINSGKPAEIGFTFGPTWSTHWFHLKIVFPDSFIGKTVCLLWDSQCEALVYSSEGQPLSAFSSHFKRSEYTISDSLQQNTLDLYVECAANGICGAGKNGMIEPPDENKTFTILKASVAVKRMDVYSLLTDLQLIHDFIKQHEIGNRPDLAGNLLQTANAALNVLGVHSELADVETVRKAADVVKRGFYDKDESANFAIKSNRMEPVGSAWIEFDGNIPSGESFIRQILYGQKFFLEHFGRRSSILWLPDTFGYAPQLPQILRQCGVTRFVSQKMSWNLRNKFPHSTFWWFGLDNGLPVLAHFPPGSYVNEVNPKECIEHRQNFLDHGRSDMAMYLYGFGDGGGGPTDDMCQRLDRIVLGL